MGVTVVQAQVSRLPVTLRLPFHFGNARIDRLHHAFLKLTVMVEGQHFTGLAGENLMPGWFRKSAGATAEADEQALLHALEQACRSALELEEQATVFELWRQVYQKQQAWGRKEDEPALVWGLGVALVERAVIDAFCRARGASFDAIVRHNALGLDLAHFDPQLSDVQPAEGLPERPIYDTAVRQTVGLGDPLTHDDVDEQTAAGDRLPQSLTACMDHYGVRWFKVKLSGDVEHDLTRLRRISRIVEAMLGEDYTVTLDANEQFTEVARLRYFWEAMRAEASLAAFRQRVHFLEQPLPRHLALTQETARALHKWPDRPPLIIDESDDHVGALQTALRCGYAGTSHKGCKGVIKSIANACLLAERRREDPHGCYILSGEDLTTPGPVALNQDLAVAATLGLSHIERNGHHYLPGLAGLAEGLQQRTLAGHGDVYRQREAEPVTVRVEDGLMSLGSAAAAPFGLDFTFDPIDEAGAHPVLDLSRRDQAD
jgi:hypothetical protein